MNKFSLHSIADRGLFVRWGASAALIVAAHASVVAVGMAMYSDHQAPGVAIPAIMIDMAPAPAAPQISEQDVAPGPEMEQAEEEAKPPEPIKQAALEEMIPSTPPVEKPEVEAPPEQQAKVEPPPPEPPVEPEKIEKPIEKPPEPVKKPVKEVKKPPVKKPPAPKTSAAPRAERVADASASMATAGAAAAAAMPSYRDRLAAHLQRHKQYPGEARSSGSEGTAMLSFTVSRSGQVLSSRLARSSGVASLDQETLSMIRRAQPLPAFPAEITQASMTFTVPVRFSIR